MNGKLGSREGVPYAKGEEKLGTADKRPADPTAIYSSGRDNSGFVRNCFLAAKISVRGTTGQKKNRYS